MAPGAVTLHADGAMAATGVTASTARHNFLGDEDKDTSGPASLAFYIIGALDSGGP